MIHFYLRLKMDVGHPKHVLQTKNCVFVSQSHLLLVFSNSSQCPVNMMGEFSLSWKVSFLYVWISTTFNKISLLLLKKENQFY